MKEIVYRIVNGGLKEMKGLSINGNVPLDETIVNEMLQNYLYALESPVVDSGSGNDFQKIFKSLDRRNIHISLEKNVANLKIEFRKH